MAEETETVEVETVKVRRKDLLSTGSTLLNLACSGHPDGGFLKGKYYLVVGDSDSGKTFFSMTCLAEATINPHFKDYRFIYDNIEDGMLMDLDTLFNSQVADRIEPPRMALGDPVFSDTIENFYYHLDDAFDDGRPFIYILDSQDALDSDAAEKKFGQHKKAYRKKQARAAGEETDGEKDEKLAGSFGDGKAKKHSEYLRKALSRLRGSGSILIVISQTRDNLTGYGGKTRSGGRALAFYATMQIWTSIAEKIRRNIRDKARDVGSRIKLEIRRNRITGKRTDVEVDIYPSFGIDDIGSCVDYLVEEKWWPKKDNTITAEGLGVAGTREKIIRKIERSSMEDSLREVCGDCWKAVDEAMSLKRKNRYADNATEQPE